jgi:CHASE1-domain containing sensor protein
MKLTNYLRSNLSPALTFSALIISLLVTYLSYSQAKSNLEQKTQAYFDFRVREALDLIKRRMTLYEQVLYGTNPLFNASSAVTRNEFKQYVATLNLTNNFPGIQGVGFSQIVPPTEVNDHIEAIQNEGFPNYTLWPQGQRDIYTAIIYLEPFDYRNRRAFGYDMFSEPSRRDAMQRAIDTGQTQLTDKIKLVQETGENDQAGFLIYLPVYSKGNPTHTIEA